MNKIYSAFVNMPDDYIKNHSANPAISHFVYYALKKHFGNRVIPVLHTDDLPLSGNDLLVSIVPNQNLNKWKRSIIISNDNFDVDKWKLGKFTKYGLNLQTDHTIFYNCQVQNNLACFCMTNDLAINRWNNNHPQVAERKKWLQDNVKNFVLTQPPLDKKYLTRLYDSNKKFKDLKMLVYHDGWRKNAKELIDLLNKNGFKNKFDIINSINKEDDNNIMRYLNKYTYLAHTSVSEAFPYLASDLLCQGLVLFGHEEWWHGYGHNELTWSYDPQKENENLNKLKKILSNDFIEDYHKIRKNICEQHINRTDNDWNYFTNLVVKEVEEHV